MRREPHVSMSLQTKSVREKEMKRQTLLELVDYVNTGTGKFTEPVRWEAGVAPRLTPALCTLCAPALLALETLASAAQKGRAGTVAPQLCALPCAVPVSIEACPSLAQAAGCGGTRPRTLASSASAGKPPKNRDSDVPLCFLRRSEDIVFMLNANLFRALPPSKGGDQENYDPDEEEPSLEPTWPHLQVGFVLELGLGFRVRSRLSISISGRTTSRDEEEPFPWITPGRTSRRAQRCARGSGVGLGSFGFAPGASHIPQHRLPMQRDSVLRRCPRTLSVFW